MNKRKLLTLALSLCMIAILAIGGTMAYFTDTDEATNVFTFGNVKIEQYEQQRGVDGKIEGFKQNQNVYPAVMSKLTPKEAVEVNGYPFEIRSKAGNYIDKIVNVENQGTEPAYIRTIIAVPNMNGYDDTLDATHNPLHWNYLDASDFGNIGWDWNGKENVGYGMKDADKISAVKIGGIEYDLYVATYNEKVAANAVTSPSLVGFYLDGSVDYDEDGYFFIDGNKEKKSLAEWIPIKDGKATLNILVATQACQTEGFGDAWEALDAAFGDITATNNPWVAA